MILQDVCEYFNIEEDSINFKLEDIPVGFKYRWDSQNQFKELEKVLVTYVKNEQIWKKILRGCINYGAEFVGGKLCFQYLDVFKRFYGIILEKKIEEKY